MAAAPVIPETIFEQAIAIVDESKRAAYLDRACAGNAGLRQEAEQLVGDHFRAGTFLEQPAIAIDLTCPPAMDLVGCQIGPYKLLEQIGEGGMGVVYVAEQAEPVRRRVALKIIKPGMDTKQVIARFEAERQALAMMEHPNIAKILEAGMVGVQREQETGDREQKDDYRDLSPVPCLLSPSAGRPYFVMELVRGLPITEYCDKARLGPRQRLALFADVCSAVQHAHQKGVIHRDLKPSNVMITVHDGRPVPKVIDFGVAKAGGQQLTERTVYTALTQLVGTPLYMSPEQADLSSQDVDTRSDVYSLGVLLYELLTGQTPFDKERLKNANFDEMRRIIREEEPETVSQRIAKTRSAECGVRSDGIVPRSAFRVTRWNELDWIVMKALEKDRSRRYESASALAADIQRYLSDEPVLACPPTAMYRFQKFARKHKPALATAAAIAACLILGTTVSAWQAVRATTAEAQANANAVQAEEKTKEATEQRDEAQRQRDEVKSLIEKLQATQAEQRRTLYAAQMILAQRAWNASDAAGLRVLLRQQVPTGGQADLRGFEWNYLSRLGYAEVLTIDTKLDHLSGITFSPDGKRVASSGSKLPFDGSPPTTRVWDIDTGRQLLSIADSRRPVFSPDGKRLAAHSTNGDLKLFNAETGEELLTIKGPRGVRIAFSSDGQLLASASADKSLKVWNATSGEPVASLKGHGTDAVSLAFSPDGKRLASGARDGTLKVWDYHDQQEPLTLKGSDGWVNALAFSPDGARIVTAEDDGKLRVWDAAAGAVIHSLEGHVGQVFGAAYSPDGKTFASSGADRTIRVWDAQSGQELRTFRGHANLVESVAFSRDGGRLASSALDGTIKVWDAAASRDALIVGSPKGVYSAAFSPDGKRLAIAEGNWDEKSQAITHMAIKLCDATIGKALSSIEVKSHALRSVAFSPDGKQLAGTLDEKTPAIWDVESGQLLLELPGHTARINKLVFSGSGNRLATASDDKTVKVWNTHDGSGAFTFSGHTKRVNGLAFSPDGSRLISCSQDGTVKVWDSENGHEFMSLEGHTAQSSSVAFSPDGARLATVKNYGPGGVGLISLLDAKSGNLLMTLSGHTAVIGSVVFSPDGKRLASGSGNPTGGQTGEVKIWDAQTGQELLSLKGGGYAHAVAFSPDGNRLSSLSRGTLKIYDATPLPEKP